MVASGFVDALSAFDDNVASFNSKLREALQKMAVPERDHHAVEGGTRTGDHGRHGAVHRDAATVAGKGDLSEAAGGAALSEEKVRSWMSKPRRRFLSRSSATVQSANTVLGRLMIRSVRVKALCSGRMCCTIARAAASASLRLSASTTSRCCSNEARIRPRAPNACLR